MGRDPGIHVIELANQTGLSWHTTAYHLSVLARTGKVVVQKSARDRCVFLRKVPARHRAGFVAMRAEPARGILHALREESRMNVPALARRLRCSEKVVRRRLADLVGAGVLERLGTWRPVYQVKPAVAPRIASLLPKRRRHSWAGVVGTWTWDPRGNRPQLSKDSLGLLGLAKGTPCESLIAFVHPHERGGLSAAIRLAVVEGQPYDQTVGMRTPRGEVLIRQRGWVVSRGRNGKARLLTGTLEDVTGPGHQHRRPEPAPHPSPDESRSVGAVQRLMGVLPGRAAATEA